MMPLAHGVQHAFKTDVRNRSMPHVVAKAGGQRTLSHAIPQEEKDDAARVSWRYTGQLV